MPVIKNPHEQFERAKVLMPPDFAPLLEEGLRNGEIARTALRRFKNNPSVLRRFRRLARRYGIRIVAVTDVSRSTLGVDDEDLQAKQPRVPGAIDPLTIFLLGLRRKRPFLTKEEEVVLSRRIHATRRREVELLFSFSFTKRRVAQVLAESATRKPTQQARKPATLVKAFLRLPFAAQERLLADFRLHHRLLALRAGEIQEELARSNRYSLDRERLFRELAGITRQVGCDAATLLARTAQLQVVAEEFIDARRELAEANYRFVVSVAKRYRGRGLDFLDLIQEGNLGLLTATERFHWRFGVRFLSYASWWIKQSITRAIADQGRIVRLPTNLQQCLTDLNRVLRHVAFELKRNPAPEDLATALGWTVARVNKLLPYLSIGEVSLDAPVGEDASVTLGEILIDRGNVDFWRWAETHELRRAVGSVLSRFPRAERAVLHIRFGFGGHDPVSLTELARILELPIQRVRALDSSAMDRLRQPAILEQLAKFTDFSTHKLAHRANPIGSQQEDRSWFSRVSMNVASALLEVRFASFDASNGKARFPILSLMEAKLDDRERNILSLRYGIGGDTPRTLEQVAAQHSLSRERIRQIEKKALEKLEAAWQEATP